MDEYFGGIEAGGTKFVCAIGTSPDDIQDEIRFPTTTPDETLGKAIGFFKEFLEVGKISSIGIASFGPIDLCPRSGNYGYITSTPKPGWAFLDVVGRIDRALGLPVGFDTDVNGALIGEHRWGAAQGLENAIYLTIGTGIGGGAIVNSKLIHGLVHPEMGHVILPPRDDDPFPEGWCPYHGNCLEGMAAGPAMEIKWNTRAENLEFDHPAWDLEAHYLAKAIHGFICTLSPQRIILGGGVMNQKQLYPLVRQKTLDSLNGYIHHPGLLDNIEEFIVPPVLGNRAGIYGAFVLAGDVLRK